MPDKPLRPCSYSGCPELSRETYCPKHRQAVAKERDSRRANAADRGYSTRWQKARKSFLIDHPLCAECERQGRLRAAALVDHIIPHKGNIDLFWDHNNWQPLCKQCHDLKTAKQDGGFGHV